MKSQRLTNSWALVKASRNVLINDKKLCFFPIIAMICSILLFLTFLIPHIELLTNIIAGDKKSIFEGVFLLFWFYLINHILIFFCNTALISAALEHLRGGTPSVYSGFCNATRHLPAIVVFALFSSTIGVIVRVLEETDFIGTLISCIISFSWTLATFLFVPTLIIENKGAIDTLSRSISLMKTTWGESIIGGSGINLISIGIAAVIISSGSCLVPILFQYSHGLGLATGIVVIMSALAICIIGAAVDSILKAAVYLVATTGIANSNFSEEVLQSAFRKK